MPKPPSTTRSIRLPDALWERAAACAKGHEQTVNAYVQAAVTSFVEMDEEEEEAGSQSPEAKAGLEDLLGKMFK